MNMKMNRVKDLYETAALYLELPPMAQYVISGFFGAVPYEEFVVDSDAAVEKVFLQIIANKDYPQFRQVVRNYERLGCCT